MLRGKPLDSAVACILLTNWREQVPGVYLKEMPWTRKSEIGGDSSRVALL